MAATPGPDLPLVIPSGLGCHHHELLLLLSLLNLGCLFFCLPPTSDQPPPPRRRKISPFSHPEPSPPAATHPQRRASNPVKTVVESSDGHDKSFSFSIRSYIRQLFSVPSPSQQEKERQWRPCTFSVVANPASTLQEQPQLQLRHYLLSPDKSITPASSPATSIAAVVDACVSVAPVKRPSFSSRADIYPCTLCGEIFNKTSLLDLHQATRHAFSELCDGDSGKNIVTIIFRSGWKGSVSVRGDPAIHRVLKIHHSPRTLARFEEYRDAVRSRAAAGGADERCIVDGNERLRFYCATFLCGLGREGDPSACENPFCAACGIVRHGFFGKEANGIPTHATAWAAHASLPEELEREFAFMRVRRAMLVCRVVAGRAAPGKSTVPPSEVDGAGYEYDSVVAAGGVRDGGGPWAGEGELVVFNARAVLPCFVVVYSCCM